MMYPPCPPWAGWFGLWAPPLMHFHSGWSGPTESFGHGGYYVGDSRYGSVDHQQDRKAPRQEKRMVWNLKPDGPISPKTTAAPDQQNMWWVPNDGASASGLGGSQGQTGPRSKVSANNDQAKPNTGRSPEEVVEEPNRVPEEKAETKIEARTNSQGLLNRTVWFPKLDHPISSSLGQKRTLMTTAPGTDQHPIGVLQDSHPARGG
jgi:hypothetical protein